MSDIEQLKLFYTMAFVMWIIANVVVTRTYVLSWWRSSDRNLPFVLGGIFVGLTSMVETGFYAFAIWTDIIPELRLWAIKLIPLFASSQAMAYIIVGFWARRTPPEWQILNGSHEMRIA